MVPRNAEPGGLPGLKSATSSTSHAAAVIQCWRETPNERAVAPATQHIWSAGCCTLSLVVSNWRLHSPAPPAPRNPEAHGVVLARGSNDANLFFVFRFASSCFVFTHKPAADRAAPTAQAGLCWIHNNHTTITAARSLVVASSRRRPPPTGSPLAYFQSATKNASVKKARLRFFVFFNEKKTAQVPKWRGLIHIRKAKGRTRVYYTV